MAKFTYSSPIFDITPSERAEKLARADQNIPMDPDIEEMVDADLQFVIGGRNSLTGALGGQLGMWMASGEGEENNPLNLTKKRSEVSPVTDPLSWTMENNPEGIAKRLENVPYEEYPYLLSSSSWNEFERRVMFVKSALPEAQKYGSSLGAFAGYGSDIAGMIGLSLVAEPVALTGLGVRGPLAAQAASATLGMDRVIAPAIAASEAAATISRTNLAARWLALGAAEEAVYQAARNGVDPVYDPSASSVVGQIAFSGGISSILGGAVFGRAFVRSHIEDAASEFRRLRTTNLPGGYTITWGDRWHFNAPAAADQMLFAPGALSLSDEARRVGRDLFFDWRRRADLGVADMNIPGTRTLPIGEVPIVGAPRPVRSRTQEAVSTPVSETTIQPSGVAVNRQELAARAFLEEPFTIVRAGEMGFERGQPLPNAMAMAKVERGRNQWNLADSPVPLIGSSVYRETSSESAFDLVSRAEEGFRRYTPFFVSDNPDLAISQGGKGVFIEFDASLVNGTVNREKPIALELGMGSEFKVDRTVIGSVKSLTFKNQKTLERFKAKFSKTFDFDNVETTERGLKVSRRKEARSTKVAKAEETPIFEEISQTISPAARETPTPVRGLAEEIAEEAQRPLRPTIGTKARETMGIRSIIKAAAFELSLAGVELTEETFTMLARVAVNTYNKRASFGAFNKAFWEEVSTQIPPEAVARLRPVNERAFIGGIDRTVMDAATREDMVSAIWDHFRAGSHLDSRNEASLIFQVLQQIRDRGGMVNRKIIADVVDELRKISQNPPKRVNARGKTVLDPNARRLAVINLVNKHTGRLKRTATQATPINIPTFLLNRLSMGTARGIPPSGTLEPLTAEGPSPRGGPRDFSDYPQLRQFGTERIPIWSTVGNQSARAMESNNGAARMIAWHVFNARRALDHAQPMTIMENGLMLMHKTMYMFNRAYRNGFVQYAMGGGTTNVTDLPTVVDYMRYAFGRREVARQFHQRVAKQLRTGAMDDAVSGVNEAARGMRELLNNVHSLAASVNLRGFTQQAVANYMPRMWRFDRIRRLATTEAGRQDLVALMRTALDHNGGRRIVIDGVEQTVSGDLDAAAKAFADRLISIATKTENAPLIDQEQALADALMELAAPIRGRTPSRTPYGRARTILNEEASIRVRGDHFSDGSGSMSIADLTNDDLPFVFRKYVTSVLGAVNEKRLLDAFNAELRARNIQTPAITLESGEVIQAGVEVESVEAMMKVARKLGGEIGAGQEEGLKEVIAAMRFEPFQRSSATIGDRILGIALPYGYLTTGGQFGLAALGEMGRIVGTLGVRRMLIQMPILTEMLSNWKNLDRPAQNFASFMDAWFSPSTDRLRRALFDPMGGGLQYGAEEGGMIYRGTRRVLDGTANAMSDITGLAPITSFTQQLTAATTLQHLYDVARGGAKRLDPATIRTLGLEPEQYEQIIQFVGRNAEVKDGFLGARIVGMANIDHREMDLIRNFVYRMHTSRIQSIPTRGDFHKHVFSFVGRLLTQFRTFNLKGIDNFLIQNAGRVKRGGAARVSQEIAWTMVFAGSLQYARNYADYRTYKSLNNKKKMEELEPLLGPEGFVKGAMTGPSEWFLFGNTVDAVKTRVWGGDPIFSPYRYTGLSWWGFPGEAMARRVGSVTEDVYGATVGKSLGLPAERDITQSTVHNMRLLIPGQNIPGLKQFFSITEDDIVTEYNLQRQQPREPRD